MTLTLEGKEAGILRDLLTDYLPQLRRETARTEAKELRHVLVERMELCERLLERLAHQPA